MRISLHAKATLPPPILVTGNVPLSVTIRPVSNAEGIFEYRTDGAAFLALLRKRTDLSEPALQVFAQELKSRATSKIPAVTFTDELLQEIGYYID